MYFLYSLGGVTFNKCWITLSILNCYSPNFQGFTLMKNALNNQVVMLGDMFLWLVANLKQGVIYFIKLACGNDILASVYVPRCSNIKVKKGAVHSGSRRALGWEESWFNGARRVTAILRRLFKMLFLNFLSCFHTWDCYFILGLGTEVQTVYTVCARCALLNVGLVFD